ncbi:MAG TPA: AI-2E family transporter [Candidatus Acidoferrales bacterium]|nr:AI-2E family transporter [Candidatus Acidoferrales bacterium]
MATRTTRDSTSFPPIVTAVVCIAGLYFARSVLVPIALAVLFAFLLAPLVNLLQKAGLGRTGPVLAVVLLVAGLLAGLGWLVFNQTISLATQIPNYRTTISRKIETFRGVRENGIGKAEATVNELGKELSSTIETPSPDETNDQGQKSKHTLLPGGSVAHPVPVLVVQQNSPIASIRTLLGPFLGPLATLAIVMVFTAFILLRSEDLRDRLFALAGLSRFHVTTQAFDEATQRVGRYLFFQFLMNLGYGTLFGGALYFIGVPNAFLWGVLAALLRFVPYLGTMVGAAMPLLLSLAVFEGWAKPLMVFGAFVIIEILTSYVVEPLVYAAQTGVSSLAILVAAIFWAALWGPVGLLLSTPLTVCIVVIGRYIPQWEFLSVLLGDKRVQGMEVQLYQRLRGMDTEGAREVIDSFLKEGSIEKLYESVITPVLIFIEKDRADVGLGDAREQFVFRTLKDIIEELTLKPEAETQSQEVDAEAGGPLIPSAVAAKEKNIVGCAVACIPARDEGDEILGMMLAHLATRAGYASQIVLPASVEDMIEETAEQNCEVIYISALPPYSVYSMRRLYKKLRVRFPKSRIGIGLWGFTGNLDVMRTRLGILEADVIVNSLSEATNQFSTLAEAVPQ